MPKLVWRKLIPFMLASALLIFPENARSQSVFDTGNDLLSMCDDKLGGSHCLGTAVGYADMLFWMKLICSTGTITKGQVIDIIKKYIRDNPAERHKAAAGLAYAALTKAFPCKAR